MTSFASCDLLQTKLLNMTAIYTKLVFWMFFKKQVLHMSFKKFGLNNVNNKVFT